MQSGYKGVQHARLCLGWPGFNLIGTSYRLFTDVWARQRDFVEVSAFISTLNEARGGNKPGLRLRLLLARRAERRQAETRS